MAAYRRPFQGDDVSALIAPALVIGFVAGLRSLTAPAAISWAAHAGWLDLHDSPLSFMGSTAAVAILSILALAELVADKLPFTPNRTSPGPLLGRIVMGGLSGACLGVAAGHGVPLGAVLGGAGAVAGAFAGYQARRRLVKGLGARDIVVALSEDLVAIALAYLTIAPR
jgi:uncharacterized membrane protein